jgi:ketosteroid isomerase-like protein
MSSSSLCATENTRQFLTDWFAPLETTGFDGGVLLGALSDDLIWTATGTSPVSGTFQGKQSYIDQPLAPPRRPTRAVAPSERGADPRRRRVGRRRPP